jgi:hypothetical protein
MAKDAVRNKTDNVERKDEGKGAIGENSRRHGR